MTIRFATCNILFDDGKSEPRWNKRAKHLVQLICELSPDVIATQEGRKDQLLELRDLLKPDYELVEDHRNWDDIKMYPCLFINKDRVSCIESFDRWLSETPNVEHSKSFGSRWPKLASIATLEKDHQIFTAASFHLDNVATSARPLQAQVLVEQSETIAKGAPLVLLGDANDEPDSATMQVFKDNNYLDPFSWASTPYTFHGFKEKTHDHRIDYILHDEKMESKKSFVDSRTSDHYSDHFMVIADMTIKDS
jgi:endonuclease/exonuclease/phosphatase family metal-dependent hydrolase